jgi:hypothetical protein
MKKVSTSSRSRVTRSDSSLAACGKRYAPALSCWKASLPAQPPKETRFTLMLLRRKQAIVSPESQPPVAFQPGDQVDVLIGTDVGGARIEAKSYAADDDQFYLIRPDG